MSAKENILSDSENLLRRWDGAGSPWLRINMKFGYMVFALSCVNVLTIWFTSCLKVRVSPTSPKSERWIWRLLRKLVYFPLYLLIIIWLLFMVLLLFFPWYQGVSTTPSYIHFKIGLGMLKRSGRIGLALYPMIIFLSLKPNPLPNVLYMHLIPLHKWISRVSIAAIFIHCFGFYGFWIHKNELNRTWEYMMFPGVVTFVLMILIFVLGIKPIRERCYKLFYALHIFTAWASLPMMYIHCMPEANLYIFGSLYLLIYHTGAKIFLSYNIRNKEDETNSFHTVTSPESDLLLVRIPSEKIRKASTKFRREQDNSMLTYFSPGSHIRLSPRFFNPKSWIFATHPYTIASLDTEEFVDLILKKSNKFARHIASQKYFCYTVSLPFPAFDDFFFSRNLKDNITIVSGGAGIAFGLPIFKYFQSKNRKSLGESNDRSHNLKFCIIVRNKEDLFVLKEAGVITQQEDPDSSAVELAPGYDNAEIEIFVTGSDSIIRGKKTSSSLFQRIKGAIKGFKADAQDTQYYEMDDLEEPMLEQSTSFSVSSDSSTVGGNNLTVKTGRPKISEILDDYHRYSEEDSSLVVACGPDTLLKDCHLWCKKNLVEFCAESFSM